MANMSYCRFRNTLDDLRDCDNAMAEDCGDDEIKARKSLIRICCDIAVNYCWEVDREINEE